jgi:hypothetical protein
MNEKERLKRRIMLIERKHLRACEREAEPFIRRLREIVESEPPRYYLLLQDDCPTDPMTAYLRPFLMQSESSRVQEPPPS